MNGKGATETCSAGRHPIAADFPTSVCNRIRHLPRPSGHLLEFSARDCFGKTIVNLRQSFLTMLTLSPINVDTAHAWRDAGNYAFVGSLPSAGCAWEFLRRNPEYQKAWRSFASKSNLCALNLPNVTRAQPTSFGIAASVARFCRSPHRNRSLRITAIQNCHSTGCNAVWSFKAGAQASTTFYSRKRAGFSNCTFRVRKR